ncbi:hypothetical protein CRG98_007695 [Punica granatum]|uniref:SMP domain-containing protein n=1 Tax=Punica granatum TaxID=22663 RepID=A0A2I0KTW9_PUNGR|nr:hypothetical protein CRG98_007695 [Punica granatum]
MPCTNKEHRDSSETHAATSQAIEQLAADNNSAAAGKPDAKIIEALTTKEEGELSLSDPEATPNGVENTVLIGTMVVNLEMRRPPLNSMWVKGFSATSPKEWMRAH